jgi:hypothetical protein
MANKNFTHYKDFSFIVKKPGEAKCKLVSTDLVLTHSETDDYSEFFDEFNGALFCSSTDNDFEKVLELYNSPVSFDCIAIDRIDVDYASLDWLEKELLDELGKRYENEYFYDILFLRYR